MSELKWIYKHFRCEEEELQQMLTNAGANGWQLHTCEPVVPSGAFGTGHMTVFVVMSQVVEQTDPEASSDYMDDDEGLAMRG